MTTPEALAEREAIVRPRRTNMVWNMDQGCLLISYPSNLASCEVEDVALLFDITLKGMRRRAENAHHQKGPDHG